MKKFLLVIFTLLFAAMNTWAATWYVATTGSNTTGDGSSGNPWQTIQFAINNGSVANSDIIMVVAGTYNESIIINKSLTIQSVSGATSTILDGNSATENYYMVSIEADNVIINGFTITNPLYNSTADASGFLTANSGKKSNIRITNCIIHDMGSMTRPSAYGTYGINSGPVNGLEIDHNVIYNIGNADAGANAIGILTWGNDATVESAENINIHDNEIYDITHPSYSLGIAMGYMSRFVTINTNNVHGSGTTNGIQTSTSSAGACSLTNNIVTDLSGIGLILQSPFGQTVQYNSVSGCVTGVEVRTTADVGSLIFDHNKMFTNSSKNLNNLHTSQVDAETNYWGTVNAVAVAATISGNVDYDPWCNADFSVCGYSGTPSPFYNVDQGTYFATLQEAIDGANTGEHIQVLEGGTYACADITNTQNIVLTISNASGAEVIITGCSIALTVSSGDYTYDGFTWSTADPNETILVSGGKLTLRNCTIIESTGSNQTGINVTGAGQLDAGNSTTAGHNTFVTDGTGKALTSTSSGTVTAIRNYWGSILETVVNSKIVGVTAANYIPWCNSYFTVCGDDGGPYTYASKLIRAANTRVYVPIRVTRFTAVNAVSLRIAYDNSKLTYVDAESIMGPDVPSGSTYIDSPVAGLVTVSYTTGADFALDDNDTVVLLAFDYTTGLAPITFQELEPSSIDLEYSHGDPQTPYYDYQTSIYYLPGYVTNGVLTFTREYPGYPPVPGAATQGIIAHLTGGTVPYSYSWVGPDGPAGNTQRITPTSYGYYTVTITDNDGATISGTYYYGPVHNIDTYIDYDLLSVAANDSPTLNGHTIVIDPVTIIDNAIIGKRLTIEGAGPTLTTIRALNNDADVIQLTVGGLNSTNRMTIKNLKVTSPSSTGGSYGGIAIRPASNTLSYFTFDNIDASYNTGGGAGILLMGTAVATDKITDVVIKNSALTFNKFGFYTKNTQIDGLTFDADGVNRNKVEDNTHSGILVEGNGALATQYDNFVIHKTDLSRNNSSGDTDSGHGEMFLLGFNGDLDVDDVVVTSGLPVYNATPWYVAIGVNGKYTGGAAPSSVMNFKNITFNDAPGALHFPRALLGIWTYSNLDAGVLVDNCQFNGTGRSRGGLYLYSLGGTTPLTVQNTSFAGNSKYLAGAVDKQTDICLVSSPSNVTATNAVTFTGALNNFDIEDRVIHKIDIAALGLVTWIANNVYVTENSFLSPTTLTPKIQRAVDAAGTPGWTVNVEGGNYPDQVNVNKALTVLGPNSAISCNGTRVTPEARLYPSVNDPEGGVIMSVTASNVDIRGLMFDGDNTGLPGGYAVGTADVNTSAGICNGLNSWPGPYSQIDNLNIRNNYFKNLTYQGIYLEVDYGSNHSWNYITCNTFDNMWEGIQTYAMHVDISDNIFINSDRAISVHQVITACDPGFVPRIVNNNLTMKWNTADYSRNVGIWLNGYRAAAPDLDISNNTINTPTAIPLPGSKYFGFYIMYVEDTRNVTLENNTINGYGNCDRGIYVASSPSTNLKIIGGTGAISGCKDFGVLATDYDASWGSASTNLTIEDLNITMPSSGVGIEALEILAQTGTVNVTVTNDCSITGATAGILSDGAGASIYVTNNDATISGNTVGIDVTNFSTATITANAITGNGIGVRFQTGGKLVSATNNFITGSTTDGIQVAAGAGTIGPINNNDLSGNTTWAIDNLSGPVADATCNWYGMSDVAGVTAEIFGTVAFDPWLIGNTDPTDPGFQPTDPCTGATNLYVNDLVYVFGGDDIYTTAIGNDGNPGTPAAPFLTITKAVNTAVVGTNIWVDAGPFQEQVQIGKTLNITGVDSLKTIILAPATLPLTGYWYSSPYLSQPIVYAYGTGNTIDISQLCINGGGGRNVDHFIGMEYYEASGTFDMNKITGIHDSPVFTGAQRGHAFYGMYSGTGTQTLNITDNIVMDYQKGGIYVDGAGANTDVLIDGNTVLGQGVANVTAQNGISPAWCDVIITDNQVHNNIWNAVEHPHTWVASGIMPYQTYATTVTGNTMNGNEVALFGYQVGTPTYGINTFNNNKIHLWLDLASQINPLNVYDKKVLNTTILPEVVFGCIQYAVDEATPAGGDILVASAGTFIENVNVHTPVILNGPNANNDPTLAVPARVPEAIVMPFVNDAVNGRVFDVTANNVTINGFTVDGDNPGLSPGVSYNGADINAQFGIGSGTWSSGTGGKNGMIVKYNIVKNFNDGGIYGNGGGTPVEGGLFTYNRIDNNPWWGIVMETNCYTDITRNKITGVSRGIQYDNYYNPSSGGNTVVEYNNITYHKRGILQNLHYSSGSPFVISNNTLTASGSPEAANVGLMYWSIGTGITATAFNNTINANIDGIRIWNCQGNVTVDSNTVNGGQYGIHVTTNDAYGLGSTSNALLIRNIINTPSLACLYLEDTDLGTNSVSATATNNYFNGSADGVKLSGGEVSTVVNNNSITGQSLKGVNAAAYTGVATLDFNCNWWGAADFATVATNVGATNPPIDYAPWLTNGTDNQLSVKGFQPVPGSCSGIPVISGTMKYYHPVPAQQAAMNGVQLALKDAGLATIATSTVTGGNYTFTDDDIINGTYTIAVTLNPKTAGSINSTDAAQVNTWATAQYTIPHIRYQAGDVWDLFTPAITSTDAQHIQQRFVYGLINPNTGLPTFDRALWSYSLASMYVADNSDPNRLISNLTVTVNNASITNYNLFGISTGDFNSSYLWGALKGAKSSVMLTYGNPQQADVNTEMVLPLRIVNASTVGAASLILNFPSELAEIMEVTMDQSAGQLDWAVNGDELRIGWNTSVPLSFASGDVLINIRLVTTGEFLQGKSIRFSLTADPMNELADGSFVTIPDAELSINTLESNALGTPDQSGIESLTLASYPNPFADYTMIKYTLPTDGRVTLEISNVLGMKVATVVDELQTGGTYSFKLDALPLQPGVYTATIKLDTNGDDLVRTIKLVKNR
jgi:hypothetical protein